MKILLGVLFLSGWLIFSTCPLHVYHYVTDAKNWTEAQTYCRQNYTDLATFENDEELHHLINMSNDYVAWTGLYSKINWTWSDGYTEIGDYKRYWAPLKSYLSHHWCMNINTYGRWHFDNCSAEYPFICYNGTQLDPEFVFVSEIMNWSRAQSYCRENFIDLVTVRNQTQKSMVQNLVAGGSRTWIGLNGHFDMYWSDGNSINSFFWDYIFLTDLNTPLACGYIDSIVKKIVLYFCKRTFPFICYSNPPPTALWRQIVKLKLKLEDSSVDLNDPAVKADMLKQLQDKLKEKGVSGVTLKWIEHPDGKLYHKEDETNVPHDEC